MFETTLFKLDGYENPKKLVQDFRDLVYKKGAEAVLKQGQFKLDRERWVAGMTCIGMTNLTGQPWFAKPVDPKEETPDFRAAAFKTVEGRKYLVWDEVECEIVECPKGLIPIDCIEPEHIFFEHIKRTKLQKSYPSHFLLVIYSRFGWKQFSLEKLSQFFRTHTPQVAEIWDLMNVSPRQDQHLLAKLFPDRLDIEINLSDTLNVRGQDEH